MYRVAAIGAATVLLEPLAVYAFIQLRSGGGSGAWRSVYPVEALVGLLATVALRAAHARGRAS